VTLIGPTAAAWSAPGDGPGVLVLHGFTGNPTAMRPLAERLAAAGHAVELPRLPGHGTSWRDLARTDRTDWVDAALAALDRLPDGPRAVVGLSMGGLLALRLAQLRSEAVAGLVLINPWLTLDHPLRPLIGVVSRIVPTLPGVGNDIARPDADELPYDRVPLRAVASVLRLQDDVRADLGRVVAPTLVLTSRVDHTISTGDSTIVMERIAAPQRQQVVLERSFHVATLDYDADLIADRTIGWIAATTRPGTTDAPG
jgi:carboxylesterase